MFGLAGACARPEQGMRGPPALEAIGGKVKYGWARQKCLSTQFISLRSQESSGVNRNLFEYPLGILEIKHP
jgi:hypothetical protein